MLKSEGFYKGLVDGDFGPLSMQAMLAYRDSLRQHVPQWMRIAAAELGTKEIAGAKHNARIVEYHSATTLHATADEVPWCASFVSWCLEKADVRSTRSAAAASYLNWGVEAKSQFGNVVVFSRPGGNHVGFDVWQDADTLDRLILGGNQSNKVCCQVFTTQRFRSERRPA